MRQKPKPQEIYRHFKGNLYQIITIARHSETDMEMVVYQQLYSPYEVYVRPLDMFMSRVDKDEYRFEKVEKLESVAKENANPAQKAQPQAAASPKPHTQAVEDEFKLDEGIVAFLDADTYEEKLQILSSLHPRITDDMINTMAVSLDTEVKEGDIETRYSEIKNCLMTMERFECNRLR
jgi:hypothetical protein